VQSMGDLMHPCTPEFQIFLVQSMARVLQRHTFILLTKNTGRYQEFNPWPANVWVGGTVTNQPAADGILPGLLRADAHVRFVSHEPLLGAIEVKPFIHHDLCPKKHGDNPCECGPRISWAIIGAQTGPGPVKPKLSWVFDLVKEYRAAEVPVFLKNNCPWPGAKKIQEFPA